MSHGVLLGGWLFPSELVWVTTTKFWCRVQCNICAMCSELCSAFWNVKLALYFCAVCSIQRQVCTVQCNIGVTMCNSTLRGCHRLHSSTSALPAPAPVAIILSLPYHHHQLPKYFLLPLIIVMENFQGDTHVALQSSTSAECFVTHLCLNPIIFWTVFCSSLSLSVALIFWTVSSPFSYPYGPAVNQPPVSVHYRPLRVYQH